MGAARRPSAAGASLVSQRQAVQCDNEILKVSKVLKALASAFRRPLRGVLVSGSVPASWEEIAMAEPIRTVGDLIERLREFDSAAPVRTQAGVAGETDFIVSVGESTSESGAIAVVYMPKPAK
jgi:hypothetical protein